MRRIRPKQGMVLVEMIEKPIDAGLIEFEDKRSVQAKVLRLGMWAQAKNGALLPWEIKPGDKVIINPHVGQQLTGYPDRFKLVHRHQIDAVLT